MGVSKSGVPGTFTGKTGNLVYYYLNGKLVSRTVGRRTKAPSTLVRTGNQRMGITSKVMRILIPFIELGFKEAALSERDNAFNMAMSYNMRNAVAGEYPDVYMDFSKMRLSEGTVMEPQSPLATEVAEGLRFEWAADPGLSWPQYTDQAMLLAYFPLLEKIVFQLYGPERRVGAAVLNLGELMQGEYMETYIAFISADRMGTSVSAYTGHFNKV